MTASTVLLIEDDEALRNSLAQTLELEDITVIQTAQYVQARRTIRANFNGVVLTDIRMPGHDGFDILALAQSADTELPVIMLTGEGDVPMAIRAMKEGAYDFLEKPCSTDRLLDVLRRALDHRALVLRARSMEQRMRRSDLASVNFPGTSEASRKLRRELRAAADSGGHIVLTGPHGVGKRLASHTLFHLMGADGQFLPQSAPLPENFTLPDTVSVMTLKHLRRADATTWRTLRQLIDDRPALRVIAQTTGAIPDPMTALAPYQIAVPDLAARHADLDRIFEELLRQAARNADQDMPQTDQQTRRDIAARHWAGNLAELRAYANAYLRGTLTAETAPQTLAERMESYERAVLTDTLRRHGGKATSAAEELGLPRKTFYDRLARYGLRPKDFAISALQGPA